MLRCLETTFAPIPAYEEAKSVTSAFERIARPYMPVSTERLGWLVAQPGINVKSESKAYQAYVLTCEGSERYAIPRTISGHLILLVACAATVGQLNLLCLRNLAAA